MFDIVLKALGSVIGSKEGGKSQLLELFKGDRQKEREFELKLNEQYEKRITQELADRQDARGMQVAALKQDNPYAKMFIYWLTGGIILITGILAIFPMFIEVPASSVAHLARATDFFYMIAGGSVIGFFYGTNTSKDSKNGN